MKTLQIAIAIAATTAYAIGQVSTLADPSSSRSSGCLIVPDEEVTSEAYGDQYDIAAEQRDSIDLYQGQIRSASRCEVSKLQEWEELTNFSGVNYRSKLPTAQMKSAEVDLGVLGAELQTLDANIGGIWTAQLSQLRADLSTQESQVADLEDEITAINNYQRLKNSYPDDLYRNFSSLALDYVESATDDDLLVLLRPDLEPTLQSWQNLSASTNIADRAVVLQQRTELDSAIQDLQLDGVRAIVSAVATYDSDEALYFVSAQEVAPSRWSESIEFFSIYSDPIISQVFSALKQDQEAVELYINGSPSDGLDADTVEGTTDLSGQGGRRRL